MVKDYEDFAFELDEVFGAIASLLESLNDVKVALGNLRDEMDEAVLHGNERFTYREHHRTVRILSEFMQYLMKDFVDVRERAYQLNRSFFQSAVTNRNKTGEAKPGNDKTNLVSS